LDDNGGPTLTHALLSGSPAIDAGNNAYATDWDQRGEGFPRIVNDIIDIGAFEVQDGGNGPGRSSRLGFRPVRFEAAALVGIQSLLPVSHIASEAEPLEVAVDSLFANDRAMQPGVVVGRPTVGDPLMAFHRQKGSRQDFMEADAFDLFGVFLTD
jgi:hypothetical protein